MREVAPGDVVFSFFDTRVAALGIARSYCYESPKPEEFGQAGTAWSEIGWRVDVAFRRLSNAIRPMDHISRIRSLLPAKYAPLRASNGHGLQSVYLAEIPSALAAELFHLIGSEASQVQDTAQGVSAVERANPAAEPTIEEWESRQEAEINATLEIGDTMRKALVMARRGQGQFRQNLMKVERRCRVTRVDRLEHLMASHAKPWRDCGNAERLDGENGLLLTPNIDHLFDKGFISFEGTGRLIVSPVAHQPSLVKMGIDPRTPIEVGAFSSGQKIFLEYHRENVLRRSAVSR